MAFSVLETRWSPEYFRRKKMMKTLQVPTISDTKDMAGLPLASLLFDQCYPELKPDYGLAPYLNGPQGDLWVAPKDSLNGKVVLTPSPTEKHMYALTHLAIIELGPALEQKFLNEGRLWKESALEQLEKFLMGVYETEKAALLAALREEEKLEYGSQLKKIQDYYDAEICKIVTECYEQIERLKEEMAEEVDSINIFWKDRAQQEINETVAKVTGKFLDKMKLQEQILVRIYIKQIRAIQDKKKCAINFERKKYNEKIKEMKHQLHCQNVADLMYLLCKERRRCKVERNVIRKHYVKRVRKMKSISKQKSNEIKDLMKLKIKRERQFIVREQCLVEILRQYQKFIYFALKAVPTQAEFLLNIDQLLKFELDDYGLSQQVTQTEVKPQPELQVLADHDLDTNEDIEDYLRYLQSLSVEEEFECSDVLPAFYYKDGMYVREDFRDMFSAGRQIGRNHPLWNPDVEELLNIFRKACEKPNSCQTDRVDSHLDNQRKLILGSERSESTQIQTFSSELSKSAVRVSTMNAQHTKTKASTSANHAPEYEEEREIRKLSLGEGPSGPPRPHVLSRNYSANPLQHQMASHPETQWRVTHAH
ncbi:uncharacterized protein LOC135137188 isoform X1 [Zophobas morio]|uniref:uncharacterized protein LOC135137188 isoform X1 n=2 Tax=Zophobas morio TaxID=2755281 RepID=UPI003082F7ED